MYSEKVMAKFKAESKAAIDHYMSDPENLKKESVRISAGNVKIGKVLNVSTMPMATCGNCKECCKLCYDIKAVIQYTNVKLARAINTAIMRLDRERYFAEIDNRMFRRRKNKYFRWHVAGDIPDYNYFCRMVENARNHPDFVIWTYTKMYHIVNMYVMNHGGDRMLAIPENLHIMFSEWRGMDMVNPYGFPEFKVVFKDDLVKPDPKKVWYCPGNCDICKIALRGCIVGETTYCNEH